jgi:hypothetical protein
MNLIEQLFNDFNAKYLEEAKGKGIDLGLQTVYTPIDKIERATYFRFADHITAETKSVAVLFNTEFINYFIKELPQDYINNIKFTFFYDCKFDYMQVQDCIFFSGNKLNIEMISIENIKDLDKVMAGKKFDIVFSNPPYNDNLDLKILEKLFDVSKNIIFVHPSSFLLDNKNIKQLFTRIKNTSFLKNCSLFWGNELFNIGLFVPICISYWTNIPNDKVTVNDNAFLKKQYVVNNINDISIHGDLLIIKNTIDNIKSYIDKNGSLIEHKYSNNYNSEKYYAKLPVIRGNQPLGHPVHTTGFTLDFFSLISLDIKNNINIKENDISKCIVFEFDTEAERLNFINYCKSKFARFCLSFYKINGNLNRGETKLIPWMDFTQEWNDAKLCKEFGISEKLWGYIDNFIPDYYDDYVSGF